MDQNTTPSRKIFWIAIAIIVLLGVIGGYYWYTYSKDRAKIENFNTLSQSINETWNGDYAAAEARLKNAPDTLASQSLSNTINYIQARSPQDYIALIKDLKKQFTSASEPLQKSLIVNQVSSALFTANDASVYAEAFAGEPFASLRSASNTNESMLKLASYSISLQPTARAYLDKARAEASLAVSTKASDAQASQKYVDAAKTDIVAADEQYGKEATLAEQSPLSVAIPLWYQFWRGYVYGTLSALDSSYASEAHASYQKVTAAYDAAAAQSGASYAILEEPTLLADLGDARVLANTDASKNADTVKSSVRHFLSIMKLHPDMHSDLTNAFVLARRSAARMHATYVKLAAISPEFKTYLSSLGWLEQDFK